MVVIVENARRPLANAMLKPMFEGRKRVFVDLLKWDVPVVESRYEADQFDDDRAIYIVIPDAQGGHLGSARLLETETPHLLDTLFRDLCAGAPPRGEQVLEITRFCLARELGAGRRQLVRNWLVSALVDYALQRGVTAYTGVAEMAWLQQILAFGWSCRPLGAPRVRYGKMLGALHIDISAETPALLAANGIYGRSDLRFQPTLEAA
jgi:acyl-homoserine lactone synthase